MTDNLRAGEKVGRQLDGQLDLRFCDFLQPCRQHVRIGLPCTAVQLACDADTAAGWPLLHYKLPKGGGMMLTMPLYGHHGWSFLL
jgi:hypothetical protein